MKKIVHNYGGKDMFRIGQSTDIHRLVEGRKLILGGVEIAHTKGLLGHSDADVLTHAIAESILGALALGDLGKHFPDTDNAYKDMDSIWMLGQVYEKMIACGYEVHNLDALIMIEKPKMAPHIMQMRENIANALHCDVSQVSIKATRGEGLGFVGEQLGAQAQCVILLKKK
jgi:2-C-methyl-D-erythritol 2,4-cyclodiphosphate synthase